MSVRPFFSPDLEAAHVLYTALLSETAERSGGVFLYGTFSRKDKREIEMICVLKNRKSISCFC